jgi:hypothetical protein
MHWLLDQKLEAPEDRVNKIGAPLKSVGSNYRPKIPQLDIYMVLNLKYLVVEQAYLLAHLVCL